MCHRDLVKHNNTWIMVATQQPASAAVLSVHSMFPVNIAVRYLSKDKAVPEAFVTDLSAAVSNCDSLAPINWDRACENLEDVNVLYRNEVYRARVPEQEEKENDTQKPPPPPRASRTVWGGGHTCQVQKTKAQWSWRSHTGHP